MERIITPNTEQQMNFFSKPWQLVNKKSQAKVEKATYNLIFVKTDCKGAGGYDD